jgi:hypothetical protein
MYGTDAVASRGRQCCCDNSSASATAKDRHVEQQSAAAAVHRARLADEERGRAASAQADAPLAVDHFGCIPYYEITIESIQPSSSSTATPAYARALTRSSIAGGKACSDAPRTAAAALPWAWPTTNSHCRGSVLDGWPARGAITAMTANCSARRARRQCRTTRFVGGSVSASDRLL